MRNLISEKIASSLVKQIARILSVAIAESLENVPVSSPALPGKKYDENSRCRFSHIFITSQGVSDALLGPSLCSADDGVELDVKAAGAKIGASGFWRLHHCCHDGLWLHL